MYELNDTIVAVSSPSSGARVIVRITGPATIETCEQIFSPPISSCVMRDAYRQNEKTHHTIRATQFVIRNSGVIAGSVAVDDEHNIDAQLYLFLAPHSYTGDDVAEIHIHTNSTVTEALMDNLLGRGLRTAGPGEFTARAYLNGKIDLAQAEAVNEIVVSSNRFQLAAAEKLLAGRLAETTAEVRASLIDCLSLIEAGLDFSGEDIEFLTRPEAVERLVEIRDQLERLLSGSIRYESVIDLPAVGIAGAVNAGKSSLLNTLLGRSRSIVSHERKTTRDVLTGMLTLPYCKAVLFDCAGLILEPENILDELSQQAAIEALRNSSIVIFCVDISKEDWAEDVKICELIGPKTMIPVATKSDLLAEEMLVNHLAELNKRFAAEFLPISIKTNTGIELLRNAIGKKLIEMVFGTDSASFSEQVSSVGLTARHRQAVTEAIENVIESINEFKAGNDEVTAMMLRATYQNISDIEQQHIDEEILDGIFSRFCIGK
jgi:tRNA modification GTPase